MERRENPNAFKHWFDEAYVDRLVGSLRAVHPGFDEAGFRRDVAPLTTLELKDRVRLITGALKPALRLPFPEAAAVLVATLGPPVDPSVPNQFQMGVWPLVHYVGLFGIEYFDASMSALHAMTQRMSAEFDVRPFLIQQPARTLARLQQWAEDPSEHVRRLVSEGTRPRLPWGAHLPAFIADPSPILPLLERLKDDPSPYVRKSVGNNLNDIAKDHPGVVLDLCARWLRETAASERRGVVKAALRTLVKQGDPTALALLGHGGSDDLAVLGFVAPAQARVGDSLLFSFDLHNRGDQPVSAQVDYRIHHAGARGLRPPKVFKLKAVSLAPGARIAVEKRHSLKPVTTRRLYPGLHRLEVFVNGVVLAGQGFELVE